MPAPSVGPDKEVLVFDIAVSDLERVGLGTCGDLGTGVVRGGFCDRCEGDSVVVGDGVSFTVCRLP